MASIMIGLALIGLGVYDYRRQAVPDDAVLVDGTVTRIITSRSRIAGRRSVLSAPVVSYRHPDTGRTEELEPDSFGRTNHDIGDAVRIVYIPSTNKVMSVRERPWRGLAAFGLVGAAMIGFQIVEWVR